MDRTELDIGGTRAAPRARPRRAVLDALERLLRAHAALSERRDREGAYGVLRPAREDELGLIEAVFLHCGTPLPDALRAVYRRTLGIGNPISSVPLLAVPFLRAVLPDEGYGCPVAGLAAFEEDLGLHRGEAMAERPPVLFLGHAAPLGLTVSRNGLWSLKGYQGREGMPQSQDFGRTFEAAFCTFVDQTLLLWANDLAGGLVRPRDLDLTRAASPPAMPQAMQEAMADLESPRALSPKGWGDVQPLDNADLLRLAPRSDGGAPVTNALGSHTAIVGLPYGDHPEVAAQIGLGALLRLRPVDDNLHDPDAVEVWHDDGAVSVRVGFVERRSAASHRALPQGAEAWRLRVRGRSENVLYATLEVARPEGADRPDEAGSAPSQLPSDQDGSPLLPLEGRAPGWTGRRS